MEVVWLHEYRRHGFLVTRNAWVSLVKYQNDDLEWVEEYILNDDYDFWEDRATEYDDGD